MKNSTPTSPLGHLAPDEILANAAWLRTLAQALVRNSHDAEDLVQSALSAAAASKAEVRDVRGYLAGTVRRLALKMQRSRIRRADREALRAQEANHEAPPPDRSLEALEVMKVTLEEISRLPNVQARSLTLRYVEGLEVREIAERLGSSPSTVRSNLARGIASLREQLDARHGDRSAWCAVLMPMAFPRGTAGAALPTLTLPTLLTGAMIYKLAAIAALPLLFLIGRSYLVEVPVESSDPMTSSQAGESLVSLPTGSASAALSAGEELTHVDSAPPRSVELPTPIGGQSSAATTELPSARLAFVDAYTMGPLPDFEVTVTLLDEDGAELAAGSLEEPIRRTDAAGHVLLEDLPLETASLQLRDHVLGADGLPLHRLSATVSVDDDTPILVSVGPTFRLRLSGHVPAHGTPLEALAEGPGIVKLAPETTDVVWAGMPWVRFQQPLGDGGSSGPWTVTVRSLDGLLRGTADVTRRTGTEPEPVDVRLEDCGAVRFETDLSGGGSSVGAGPIIEVVRVGSDEAKRVRMDLDEARLLAKVRYLDPGRYQWSAPSQVDAAGVPIGGQIDVATGQELVVNVPVLGGPNAERFALVDASAAPEADLATWSCGLAKMSDLEFLTMPTAERAPDLGPGMWRIPVGPVPGAGWAFSVNAAEGYSVAPQVVMLTETGEIPVTRVTPLAQDLQVRLTLIDHGTGRVLTRSDLVQAIHLDGFRTERVSWTDATESDPVAVSGLTTTRFFCRAKGYKTMAVDYEPGNTSLNLTVALHRGWSNRVTVLSLATMRPVHGAAVIVEGVEVGVTDERGEYWLEREKAPRLIELAFEDEGLEVAASPFDRPDQRAGDPIAGYPFLVHRP